jgi:hypothetical protein
MARFGTSKSGNNNMVILLVVLGVLIFFGIYCVYTKKGSEDFSSKQVEKDNIELINAPDIPLRDPEDDVQFIPPPDHDTDFEFF